MGKKKQQRKILIEAADRLRSLAVKRFDLWGPHDEYGAALWNAGCYLDPNDHDALRVNSSRRKPSL